MNRFTVRALTTVFRLLYGHRRRSFSRALHDPQAAQEKVFRNLMSINSMTGYGRAHGLHPNMTMAEFRNQVPIADYDHLQPWIERQRAGWGQEITPGDVRFYEPTSGSRGPRKWIPYNRAHLQTFSNMFVLWCLDVLQSGVKPESGRIFFLISSFVEESATQDDRDFLVGFTKSLANLFFVDTSEIRTKDNFITHLAQKLRAERDLEVISVWSPSLLLMLMEELKEDPRKFWPKLKLISCWDSAGASHDAEAVRDLFPGVLVQGKGLLATEGALTLPWFASGGFVPLVNDLFYEFENVETGEVQLLHELTEGRVYRILFSAPNGFLRYRLGDLVEAGANLTLKFIGRDGLNSDLRGEKLSSAFVEDVWASEGVNHFALLVPHQNHYILFSNHADGALASRIEARLRAQYHYNLAREMGQLQALDFQYARDLREIYFSYFTKKGIPTGQIKTNALVTDLGLAEKLVTSRQSRGAANPTLLEHP